MPEPTDTPDPNSPQWEACKVCGGDHWTADHPPAPEPGADAAVRKVLTDWGLDAPTSDPPHGWRCQYPALSDPATCGHVDALVADLIAALASPTSALNVEALDIRWLLDNSNPMHYQGCEPDGCSCGVSAKYEAISDRQAVREELAARATEGGTDG